MAGRVFVGNLGGGGAKYFFSGPKCPPSLVIEEMRYYLAISIAAPDFPNDQSMGLLDLQVSPSLPSACLLVWGFSAWYFFELKI